MTQKQTARNVGTVCLGTVLLGLGCTQREQELAKTDKGSPFPEERAPAKNRSGEKTEIPKPEFGPLARRTLDAPVSTSPEIERLRAAPRPSKAPRQRKEKLLASVSDNTLVRAEKIAERQSPQELAALPESKSPSAIAPSGVDPSSKPESAAPTEAFGLAFAPSSTEEEAHDGPVPSMPVQPADKVTIATTDLPDGLAAPGVEASSASLKQFDTGNAKEVANISTAEPAMNAPPTIALMEPAPEELLAELPEERAEIQPVPAKEFNAGNAAPSQTPARTEIAPALSSSVPNSSQSHGQTGNVTARRSIPPRSGAETVTSDAQLSEAPEANVPALASMLPAKRSPVPMVTVVPPQARSGTPEVANDQFPASSSSQPQPPATALVPPKPRQTALGLSARSTPIETQQPKQSLIGFDRQSAFTASAQPPVLSYQDELILEVKIKGVDASDTIFAYGTRNGVYLPLGTLARILDLAITVSDDGHYANGWVLDQQRTLTINLRQGLIAKNGIERKLPPDLAAAFDGDLFLLSDAFAELLPISIETDLRSQAINIETLEPFPFQERLEREAERRRLAARGGVKDKEEWPRSETPWLLASLPLVDLELRALSDRTFGPRLEGDVQLAGDLAFVTAEAYLSGDTVNGMTASLIELGRQDPDAELLGPLRATAFSVGDVSTSSMPIGLRGVSGRGFAVTNTPAESVSVFERIDLRGILPDGFEVELYRNDILVGSTREAINGQYEFLQVPVDFGLNIFRLVFFGPQGQRSEQVRRISVGDGRLPAGKLVYRFGAVQKEQNVLGVRAPNFVAQPDFGRWRASGELSYGFSSGVTAVLSGAWYENAAQGSRWIGSAGVRTGLAGFAIKGDVGAGDNGAMAFSAGIGGRIGGSAVTLSHVEYSGDFIDETRSLSGGFLRRSTEFDFNSTLNLGTSLTVPVTSRIRHVESANGRKQTNAALRASTRLPGMLISNTLEYSRSAAPQLGTISQLFGNFDLASINRSKTRGRLSLGYQLLPNPDLVSAAVEVDHALDQDTAIRGSLGYAFQSKSTQVGLSAVRDFDRFTLALDGNYGFADKNYSIGLRLGLSFGRDPLSGRFFVARPGLANSGGAALRAFQDMDGDGVFGPRDSVLPEVDFIAFNQTAKTDENGIARLSGLGAGRGVSIQIDNSTLPDIDMAPATEGIEIVPRPGRIHKSEFAIVSLSEVEGTVRFDKAGKMRGVSGVRLQLRAEDGTVASYAKTELDGYYFFERVKPGKYTVMLDPDQSAKLNLCAAQDYTLSVGFEPDILKRDVDIGVCS